MKKLMKKLLHKYLGWVAKRNLKRSEGVMLELVHFKEDLVSDKCIGRPKFECIFKDMYDMVEQEIIDEYMVLADEQVEFYEVSDIEQKLYDYLKKEGVEIFVALNSGSEAFMSSEIGYECVMFPYEDTLPSFDPEERLIALAHEVGHFIDYKFNFNRSTLAFEEFTKEDDVIPEVTAWFYAREILKVLGFTNWEKFEMYKKLGLLSYTFGSVEMMEEYEYAFLKWQRSEEKRQRELILA